MEPIRLQIQFYDDHGRAFESPKNVILMLGDTLSIQAKIDGQILTVATITQVPIEFPDLGTPISPAKLSESVVEKFPLWDPNGG